MRALTSQEVTTLEWGLLPIEVEGPEVDEAQMAVIGKLSRRGLLSVSEDDEWVYQQTIPRGQLALRVHRAYLASLGGTS